MASIVGPQRQLRDKTLKDALRAFVVTPIARSYHVFAVRALWETEDEAKVQQVISGKRRELEEVFETNTDVVMFVDCIQSFEVRKGKKRNSHDVEDADDDIDDAQSRLQQEQTVPLQDAAGPSTAGLGSDRPSTTRDDSTTPKKYQPSLAFWVVVKTTVRDFEELKATIMRNILSAGLDVYDMRKIECRSKTKSVDEVYAGSLAIVLKDHEHFKAKELSSRSTSFLVTCAAEIQGHNLDMFCNVPPSTDFTSKPVTICLTKEMHPLVGNQVLQGLQHLNSKITKLDYCLRNGMPTMTETREKVPIRPASKFTQALAYVRSVMEENKYTMVDGDVYVKIPEAKYTSMYCGEPKTFLYNLMDDVGAADILYNFTEKIAKFLEDRNCKLFPNTEIDHNFIEVQPFGTCFNIWQKEFVCDPCELKGTPRAYIKAHYSNNYVPYPKHFIQGMHFHYKPLKTFNCISHGPYSILL